MWNAKFLLAVITLGGLTMVLPQRSVASPLAIFSGNLQSVVAAVGHGHTVAYRYYRHGAGRYYRRGYYGHRYGGYYGHRYDGNYPPYYRGGYYRHYHAYY